jgi:hypothetical protein
LRAALDARGLQIWVLASISAATAYMFSLSWIAYEHALIPGFAFLTALALDTQLLRGKKLQACATIAFGLILVFTATYRKLSWPYNWQNWADGPIKTETQTSRFPELKGLYMTAEAAQFLERVTQTIDAHSRPDQTIVCFPNFALFYQLAHRKPAVFAYLHWFDVASDKLVREDAARIRNRPPAVILSVDMPEKMIRANELAFRAGGRSAQRDMHIMLQSMPGYRLIDSVPIPDMDFPLNIYARQ